MINLGDIQFETTEPTFDVTLDDNSRVGERSGSTTIKQFTVANFHLATKLARVLLQRIDSDKLEDNYARLMTSFSEGTGFVAHGGYGVRIRMTTGTITGFS